MFGLNAEQILGLSVLAAIVSTIGSLTGLILKEYLFARSFETWKQKTTLRQIYAKYRDPILLSSGELSSRLVEILKYYPTVYFSSTVAKSKPKIQTANSIDDPYFQKYKFMSTIYRVCSLLGWFELFRRDLVFLDSGKEEHTKKLEECIENIRSDFADGQLNKAEDWIEWKDYLIFREELRAVGEVMLSFENEQATVMGYAEFCDRFESNEDIRFQRWVRTVSSFFLGLEDSGKDFRKIRLSRIAVHIVDLIEVINDGHLEEYQINLRSNYAISE